MQKLNYLAIDPGLQKSIGWVIASAPLIFNDEEIVILDSGILDGSRINARVIASILQSKARQYRVSEVLIEDFFFFRNEKKNRKKASYLTVAKMQRFIGFIAGYLSAGGFPVSFVHPRRWKTRVGNFSLPEGHIGSALGILIGELKARKDQGGKVK